MLLSFVGQFSPEDGHVPPSPLCSAACEHPLVTEDAVQGWLHLPEVVHRQVQLSSSAPENQLLRSEFYYEQVWRHRSPSWRSDHANQPGIT